ncbi:Fe(3+)-hydroxamate ABC transporter permease FhuB [Inquilinus sp. OTU3971]|uniref:Fe(3+)-hydroxamate ABC transporter permease FhuB n=1 Tax=Inquilinus sp. OTU3971 TaxID=3043855 RepID=UPI00313F21D7
MTAATIPAPARHGWPATLLVMAALALTAWTAATLLPPGLWLPALWSPDLSDPGQLLFRHAFLPRLAISWLIGAALGLAGTIFQQVLRNPLAEPTTLGTSAGAGLALAMAGLYAPALLSHAREGVALAGAAIATAAVFGLAGRRLAPVTLILAGLVVSLTCGSAGALLVLLHREYMTELFVWQSGSLVQTGDATALALLPRLAVAALLAALLARPLALLELEDDGAAGLGLSPARTRLAGLAVAVGLSAAVVAAVGVIGFVGLAAPAAARLCGARTLRQRIAAAPLAGALLLWLADQLAQHAPFAGEIPTGTVTALLGAPLLLALLALLPRLRLAETGAAPAAPSRDRTRHPGLRLTLGLALLLAAAAVALLFGRGAAGWNWVSAADLPALLQLRAPRVVSALAAGAVLGMAGTLLQRMTGNPMAAPEMLGISAGASTGVVLLLLAVPGFDPGATLAAASAGALATLAVLLLIARRPSAAPERLLLAGVALATMFSGLAAVVLAGDDPRVDRLLAWMSGSTSHAGAAAAAVAALAAGLMLALAPLTARWLEILPLGAAPARALGLDPTRAWLALLPLVAVPVAAATLAIGPLSFVGLMAPHMARLAGFHRALPQLLASALAGALILLAADWLGRTLIFPWQVPAGLLAAFIGGPYLLWLLRRSR